MRIFAITLILIGSAGAVYSMAGKRESTSLDAKSVVFYGQSSSGIVALKVDDDGILQTR